MTDTKGSKVSLSFTGVSLQWYSHIPTELPHAPSMATYSIDGVENAFALQGLGSPSQVTSYNVMEFETATLSYGEHDITVAFQGDNTSTPLALGYLLIQNGSESSIPVPVPTPTSNTTSIAGSKTGPNVGGIIGGVLGTLLFLLSVVAALLFYRHWRRQGATDPKLRNTIPIPFSSRPNVTRKHESNSQTSSIGPLNLAASESPPPAEPYVQQTHRRRHSRADSANSRHVAQASGSQHISQHERVEELDEQATYYGGYQTWGQTKALEAKSHATRPRDSYM
ncbi:hypothetical protein BJ912DRAFT_441554 [Pholiota molesta]|nr:hypothetical protein BJ912DRAFT_441554 [Pholiota molesta]